MYKYTFLKSSYIWKEKLNFYFWKMEYGRKYQRNKGRNKGKIGKNNEKQTY